MAKYRKRRAFSKRQADAIRRIAAPIVETKRFTQYLSPNSYVPGNGTLGGSTPATIAGAVYNSPISVIPRAGYSSINPAQPFGFMEGDTITVRGLKFEAQCLVGGTRNWSIRVSLISGEPYGTGATWSGTGSTPTPDASYKVAIATDMYTEKVTVFDQFTQKPLNPNKWTILRQRVYKLGYMDGGDARKIKMFYRMDAKKTAIDTAGTGSGSTPRMAFYNGKQYYWLYEWWSPISNAMTTTDNLQITCQQTVYWKDG